MKIAYLIMAHKELDMLSDLINSLTHPDVYVYVHFDIKTGVNIDTFSSEIINPNIKYLEKRFNVRWGGFSVLQTQILLLSTAVKDRHYDYLSFISGQDLRIKPLDEIITFHELNAGRQFLEFFELPSQANWSQNGGLDRINYFWPIDQLGFEECLKFCEKQKVEDFTRQMPNNLIPYGGSNWVTITYPCAEYILNYILKNPKLLVFFSMVACPEEIFFHTIILNSHFRTTTENNHLRYIDWYSSKDKPKILEMSDLLAIQLSKHHFARKFDAKVDKFIIAYIRSLCK